MSAALKCIGGIGTLNSFFMKCSGMLKTDGTTLGVYTVLEKMLFNIQKYPDMNKIIYRLPGFGLLVPTSKSHTKLHRVGTISIKIINSLKIIGTTAFIPKSRGLFPTVSLVWSWQCFSLDSISSLLLGRCFSVTNCTQ